MDKPLSGKKICIVVENLPVPFDRRVWQEAISLHEAGAEVSVICPKTKNYPESQLLLEGIRVFRHPLKEAERVWEYPFEYFFALFHEFRLLLKIFLKHGRQDVIHVCNPPDLLFISALPFFTLTRCKLLFDHHDINPELWLAKYGKKNWGYHLMVFFERLTFFFASHCIATNESYKEIAMTRGKKKSEDVTIVRSGPDLSRLAVGPAKPEVKNGFKFLVGYVGVMGQQEGVDLLLRSVEYIVKKQGRTDIRFCLMGSGPAIERLKRLNRSLQLEKYVDFPGRVSNEYLADILNTADVCVNPDLPSEMNDKSTMNKIMEYMAFGRPIVQYDLKEGRFSAQESSLYAKNGDTVDFADKLLWLLDNPEDAKKMGEFGRNRVRSTLSWDYEKPKLISAYKKILGL
ncbi:MAG: glycosyltransferase family 4 protein [Fibrobacteraceae bacterium]|nr:glycosyltransferase family 4 protein [Fibrobacteraceae bacterium]